MSDDNLRRSEAQERARIVSNLSYDLTLDLTTGEERFLSDTTIRFSTPLAGCSTFVDLDATAVREVTFNGRHLDPSTYDPSRNRLPSRDRFGATSCGWWPTVPTGAPAWECTA